MTESYSRILFEYFGFESEESMYRYFEYEDYLEDDWKKALTIIKTQCQMLDEALAIINDAIMHGMPVTAEVASLSNRIRGMSE